MLHLKVTKKQKEIYIHVDIYDNKRVRIEQMFLLKLFMFLCIGCSNLSCVDCLGTRIRKIQILRPQEVLQ